MSQGTFIIKLTEAHKLIGCKIPLWGKDRVGIFASIKCGGRVENRTVAHSYDWSCRRKEKERPKVKHANVKQTCKLQWRELCFPAPKACSQHTNWAASESIWPQSMALLVAHAIPLVPFWLASQRPVTAPDLV